MLPAPYNVQLALEETTLAEVMHNNGYATLAAGKWHLGGPKFSPTKQGFDEEFDFTKNDTADGYPGIQLAHAAAA